MWHHATPHADTLKNSLCINNMQGTVSDKLTLPSLYEEINTILEDISMPLQDWQTNSPLLASHIQASNPKMKAHETVKIGYKETL